MFPVAANPDHLITLDVDEHTANGCTDTTEAAHRSCFGLTHAATPPIPLYTKYPTVVDSEAMVRRQTPTGPRMGEGQAG
jgi:hypothetical protein